MIRRLLPLQVSCHWNVLCLRFGLTFLVVQWCARITSASMLPRFCNCKNKHRPGHVPCVPNLLVLSLCKLTSKLSSMCSMLHYWQGRYVDDILHSTSTDVEQVVIEPDGTWTTPKSEDTTRANGAPHPTSDDDDLIEVNESGFTPVKQEPVSTTLSLQQTPIQSREPSSAPSAARPSTNKRPAAQVIDLTASDDEEDLPVRPAKRPALNAPSHSFPALPSFSNGYTNGQDFPLSSQTNYSDTPSQRGGYDRWLLAYLERCHGVLDFRVLIIACGLPGVLLWFC